MKQEHLTLPEHPPKVFSVVSVALSYVFCLVFYLSLFAIVLSILWYTDFDYTFIIVQLAVVQLIVRGYISHYKIRRFYPNPPSLTWLIVAYNQMSSIVDIFIATKINHKDKICSFKTSFVAAQHIICKYSEHGQINTRRKPIICMAIKQGE
jgi:hypothetical protein